AAEPPEETQSPPGASRHARRIALVSGNRRGSCRRRCVRHARRTSSLLVDPRVCCLTPRRRWRYVPLCRAKAIRCNRGATMQHGPVGRFSFATLLVALGMPPRATAIDLSGDYVGFGQGAITLTVVQTGTALQAKGHFTSLPISATGTVDPATGEFSFTGE